MERELKELYTKLVEQMSDAIPYEWSEIHFRGVVEGKSSSIVFYFKDEESEEIIRCHNIPKIYGVSEKIYLNLHSNVHTTFLEIHKLFDKNKQDLWEVMFLTVNNLGKFKVNFEYEPFKGANFDLDGENVWAYESFGYRVKSANADSEKRFYHSTLRFISDREKGYALNRFDPTCTESFGKTFINQGAYVTTADLELRAKELGHQVGKWEDDEETALVLNRIALVRGAGVHDMNLSDIEGGILQAYVITSDGAQVVADRVRLIVTEDITIVNGYPYSSSEPMEHSKVEAL